MEELKNIKSAVKPHEILFVVDAMTGQDAVNAASAFNDVLGIDGVILTSWTAIPQARHLGTGGRKPIKFAGIGEKLDDLEVFHPERMASRILGMGDVLSLIESRTADRRQTGGRTRP